MLGSCAAIDGTSSNTVCPWACTPIICLNWLKAISNPEALIKPEITGWLRKLAKKPKRNTAISSKITPDSAASSMAAPIYSADSAANIGPKAAAVINETTATGPTASVRLEPKIAYKNNGAILAYNPVIGGNPASMA